VSLAEVRAHARVDHELDDALLAGYLMAAREMCEHELQRTLIATTYDLVLDAFPDGAIELPMGPLGESLSVSSITYTDPDGSAQSVSGYTVAFADPAPMVTLETGWPTAKAIPGAVRVRYVSGAANAQQIPAGIRQWILLQAGSMYERRDAVAESLQPLPFLDRLLDPYRTYL
jgi:uncharacterized phiE125 gp8 family phage protein